MAVYQNNILQQVQTYQESSLALLENLTCFVATSNTKFKEFQNETANLGSTVTFDLPPRFTTTSGLVASWQAANQRVLQLSCSQASTTSFSVDDQQRLFNLEANDYIEVFGKSAVAELATYIDSDIALNAVSGVVDQSTGQTNSYSGPYRCFLDGQTALTSYQQLAQAIMLFKNYGSVKEGIKVYLPDTIVPGIVGNGLNQFAPNRNNDIAMSWEVGSFGTPPVEYYQSNLLPEHVAGTAGLDGLNLTLTGVDDPTGQNVTQLTFSGAPVSDVNAVFAGDILTFSGTNRYLTFIGHAVSANTVQVRVLSDAASDSSGNVTISIFPALNWAGGANQNLSMALIPGDEATVLPSHKAGLIVGGKGLFVAMPKLPDQVPYPTASKADDATGVSIRLCYGSVFGQNQQGFIYSAIWGSTLVPEYSMRLAIPLSQV